VKRVNCLFSVEERKSGDHVIKTIESRGDKVLGVVTEQLQEGKHGETSVLELVELTLLELIGIKVRLAGIEVSKEAVVVNGTDQEEHLGPAESRDSVDGGDTVRDIGELEARGDLSRETVNLLDNVSDDGELANTSVLEFGNTVGVEGLLIDVGGKAKRIEVAGRGDNTKLVLVGSDGGGDASLGGRSEGGGGGKKGGDNSELHLGSR
jgi:hypothetical protein